jgi:hypothetical protein
MYAEQAGCAAAQKRQQHADSQADADEQQDWKVL